MNGPARDVLRAACVELAERDEGLARAYRESGLPVWRSVEANYATLARIVVYQLISTKAAEAIWMRVAARYPDVTARDILNDNEDALRACGLSRPKVGHMQTIAEAVASGALDFERLTDVPMDAARNELLAVKGIGPWTAETFLMNGLGKVDAFPTGDVGLMEAYRQLSGAEKRHDIKGFTALAEGWRPYRGVAAHLLYGWLNLQRARQAS